MTNHTKYRLECAGYFLVSIPLVLSLLGVIASCVVKMWPR